MLSADYSCMPEVKSTGAPDAGNLHVRCDEGGGHGPLKVRPLYSTGKVPQSEYSALQEVRVPESKNKEKK